MVYESLLSAFTDACIHTLKEKLIGVYLHGSAVMDCFNPEKSDIDIIVIVNDSLTYEEKLEFMKNTVYLNSFAPKKGIEMSIVRESVCDPFIYPTPYELHFSNTHLALWESSHEKYIMTLCGTDKDLAAHFTIIKNHGKTLHGKQIDEVFGSISKEYYADSIFNDVANAHKDILKDPVYITLNLCRVYAYLKSDLILSKKDGGEWGIKFLPSRFKPFIKNVLTAYTAKEEEDQKHFSQNQALDLADFLLKEIHALLTA